MYGCRGKTVAIASMSWQQQQRYHHTWIQPTQITHFIHILANDYADQKLNLELFFEQKKKYKYMPSDKFTITCTHSRWADSLKEINRRCTEISFWRLNLSFLLNNKINGLVITQMSSIHETVFVYRVFFGFVFDFIAWFCLYNQPNKLSKDNDTEMFTNAPA